MAEPRKVVAAPAPKARPGRSFPAAWGNEPIEVLSGYDIEEKETLLDVPFLITKVQFRVSERQIQIVDLTAKREDGRPFMFNDSSGKGVRGQITRLLTERGQAAAIETGEEMALKPRLAVLGGLRVSTYNVDVADERTGRFSTQEAKTYYLRLTAPTDDE